MPTFCRHNRFVQNCPICREPEPPRRRAASTSSASRPRRTARASSPSRRSGGTGDLRVRRVARAAEDGYHSPLVPGLRATADAERLAEELAFAAGRLTELATAPQGAFAEAATAADRDEGIRLAAEAVLRGDRSPYADEAAADRGLAALSAWFDRHGGPGAALDGDPAWTAQRRFERLFERLGTVGGIGRARYDLLVVAGALGLADVEAPALLAGDRDDTTIAAKRVFGIGDRLLIDRRAGELAEAAELPVAALDLALVNVDRPAGAPRLTGGASEDAADAGAWARAAAALGVGH